MVLSAITLQAQAFSLETCATTLCRPGRECRHLTGEEPHCACVLHCPDHWKPVCGSDGTSYSSHCSLHRAACVSGSPVSPLHPGACRAAQGDSSEEEDWSLENQSSEEDDWRAHQTPSPLPPLPVACYQKDRDSLRTELLAALHDQAQRQPWHRPDMTPAEELVGHFSSTDRGGDGFLDSEEMLEYWTSKASLGSDNQHRQVCLDALVEEGDKDLDWRLSLEEYSSLLGEGYSPSHRECSLNERKYSDGQATQLECNSCVCACGKWICTSLKCPQGYHSLYGRINLNNNLINEEDLDDYDEDDYDEEEEDDYEDPEDDPDVSNINWF